MLILSEELHRALKDAPNGTCSGTEVSDWQPLSGGRSNLCWRIPAPEGDLVLKLYRPDRAGTVFPNDPRAEAACLTWLHGHAIAPEALAQWQGTLGPCLVYRHLPGTLWQTGADSVARLLRRLHHTPVPEPLSRSLRHAPDGSAALRAEVSSQLAGLAGDAARLPPLPDHEVPPLDRPVLLHGDPVAGNLVETPAGLRLIDWQCPALGDPCLDLATFLSPAMSYLYLGRILTPAEAAIFLRSYDRPQVTERLKRLQPFLSARMIAHCLCRAAEGSAEDARAAELERQGWAI